MRSMGCPESSVPKSSVPKSSDPNPRHPSDRVDAVNTLDAARASVAARLVAHQGALQAFIRQRLGATAASERNIDDVFATTLRRSDALVRANALLAELPDAKLIALAATISRNAILESRHAADRTRRMHESAMAVLRAKASPDRDILGDRSAALSESIRSKLSDDDLAVLVLRLDDRSWPAIAAALGTTPAGAHRRYYRAIQSLAEAGVRECGGEK